MSIEELDKTMPVKPPMENRNKNPRAQRVGAEKLIIEP
jgi:hypothetical protein